MTYAESLALFVFLGFIVTVMFSWCIGYVMGTMNKGDDRE
jgi:hypothetical protein